MHRLHQVAENSSPGAQILTDEPYGWEAVHHLDAPNVPHTRLASSCHECTSYMLFPRLLLTDLV
jgi:hypothetical protein